MILPTFILKSRQNQTWQYSGMDSYKRCLDKKHFSEYPYKVSYNYNSRGFRDDEWPNDDKLQDCIWCFGDSFTVGLGSPVEHTWVNLLQQKTGKRCINISMDGASNAWIADKVTAVAETINPKQMVVQWSYGNRAQHSDTSLSDEDRKIYIEYVTLSEQISAFKHDLDRVKTYPIVHSMIPDAFPENDSWNRIKDDHWPDVSCITELPKNILAEIKQVHKCYDDVKDYFNDMPFRKELQSLKEMNQMIVVEHIDYARDYHHYDIKTATELVNQIIKQLNNYE